MRAVSPPFRRSTDLQLDRANRDLIPVGQGHRRVDGSTADKASVRAPQVLEHDAPAAAFYRDPGVAPRDARRIDPNSASRVPPDDVLTFLEPERPVRTD